MWEDISLSRRSSILGFYGCQDLNAHSAYICIKGFGYTSMKFTEEINKKKFAIKMLKQFNHFINYTSRFVEG